MSATIASNFYWSDWLSDAGLRRSCLAARGLWMDMLCIAAQHDPIGYLAIKKVALTASDIARMVGASESEVRTLLEELEQNGVLSRDRNGTIYSRRMVRDQKKSQTNKKNGKKGGNPNLCNVTGNSRSVIPPDNPEVKPHYPVPITNYQNQESLEGADATNVAPLRQYKFKGAVIRLEADQYDRWKSAYSAISDFDAALQAADDYYRENPPKAGKWFFPVSRWLAREHAAALERKSSAGTDPPVQRVYRW